MNFFFLNHLFDNRLMNVENSSSGTKIVLVHLRVKKKKIIYIYSILTIIATIILLGNKLTHVTVLAGMADSQTSESLPKSNSGARGGWGGARWRSRPAQRGWRRSSAGRPGSWQGWACQSGASSAWWWGSSSCPGPPAAPGSHLYSCPRSVPPTSAGSHRPASTWTTSEEKSNYIWPKMWHSTQAITLQSAHKGHFYTFETHQNCTDSCMIYGSNGLV